MKNEETAFQAAVEHVAGIMPLYYATNSKGEKEGEKMFRSYKISFILLCNNIIINKINI